MSTEFDWPVGTDAERVLANAGLPGHWVNSNPFLNPYHITVKGPLQLHTGVDLNLNYPHWNDDWGMPILSPTRGAVASQGYLGGSWGHVMVIRFKDGLLDFFLRLAHYETPLVVAGDEVEMGQPVAHVGNGDDYYGQSGAHLHYDISDTYILAQSPGFWPGANRILLIDNFFDPIAYTIRRKQMATPETLTELKNSLDASPDAIVTVIPTIAPSPDGTGRINAYQVKARDLTVVGAPVPAPTPQPEPNPTPEQFDVMMVIATDGIKVRADHTTKSAQVGSLPFGATASVSKTTFASDGYTWSKLQSGQGYVAREFLAPKK